MKTYYDFMSEITSDELYDRIVEYGMFSEKLPPVFSTNSFLTYCKTKRTQSFSDVGYGYITYENIRNINVPRNIGIPTPMGHELLCKCLSDNWDKIKSKEKLNYFLFRVEQNAKFPYMRMKEKSISAFYLIFLSFCFVSI